MKKLFNTLFLSLLITICAQAAEKEVVLNLEDAKIYGTLLLPDKPTQTIAIVVCGSGPTDRDGNNPQMRNNSIKYLSKNLTSSGIATLRYDKRAIAASANAAINEKDLRFETYVDDLREWIDMMSKDYDSIILIGHSEGATIATLASVNNSKVDKLVSIAGVGRSADLILKEQLASQPIAIKDIAFPIIDSLKRGLTVNNVPQMLYSLFRLSVQPYMISWFAIDPAVEIAKISQPILILQGDMDIQVSIKDASLLQEANPKSKMVIIPKMNHILKEASKKDMTSQIALYTDPAIKNAPQLNSEIVKFINQQ